MESLVSTDSVDPRSDLVNAPPHPPVRRAWWPVTPERGQWLPTAAIVAAGALGLAGWASGNGTALPMAAAIVLAARLFSRWVGRVAGVAAGTIVAFALTAALLTLKGLHGPPLAPISAFAIQALPLALFAVADLWVAGRPGASVAVRWWPRDRRTWATSGAALLGPGVFLLAVAGARLVGTNRTLTWAMGGWDSQLHLVVMRDAILGGGLTLDQLDVGSTLMETITGVVASDPSRAHTVAGALIRHDVVAMASMWALGIVLTGLLSALIAHRLLRAQPTGVRVVGTAVGSLSALAGITLGNTLSEGWFPATWSVVLLQCCVVAGLVLWQDRPDRLAALAATAGLLLVGVWALLAAPAMILAGLAFLRALRSGRRSRLLLGSAAGAAAVAIALVAYLYGGYTGSDSAIALPTLADVPTLGMDALLVLLALAAILMAGPQVRGPAAWTLAALVAGTLAGLLLLLHSGATISAYYPVKLCWLVTQAALPIAIAQPFLGIGAVLGTGPTARLRRGLATAVSATVLVALGGVATPDPSPIVPWTLAQVGTSSSEPVSLIWRRTTPPEQVADLVFNWTTEDPHVLFTHTWTRLGDRDADLWVAMLDRWSSPPLLDFASAQDVWDLTAICTFVATHPQYRVVTRDHSTQYGLFLCHARQAIVGGVGVVNNNGTVNTP
jgi:hypothetical protein